MRHGPGRQPCMAKRYHDNVSLPQGHHTMARHSINENTPKDEDDKNVTVDTHIKQGLYLQRMCEQHSQAPPTLAGSKGDNKSRSAPA